MTVLAPAVPAPPPATRVRRYLMCPPTYFAVDYCINPWMRPEQPVDPTRALRQWQAVRDQLVALGHRVQLMAAQPDLPDLVFAANGGVAIGTRGLVPRFRYPERRPESEHYAAAMRELGIAEIRTAKFPNEGEGDFRLVGGTILAGYGPRSDRRAVDEIGEFFGLPVLPLRLVDPRFYHLDTALTVLDDETVAYWPGAFDPSARAALRTRFPDAIVASAADTAQLGLNMISDGTSVLMSAGCDTLAGQVADRGYQVIPVASDELRKAGGGPKCCVLEWHPDPAQGAPAGP